MPKTLLFSLIISAALLFGGFSVKAQQPEQIDVKSLTLNIQGTASAGQFSMRTTNSSQNEVTYSGSGGYSLQLFNCAPCNLPNSFSSNGFQRSNGGFNFLWGFDKLVYFYLTEVQSDEIVLRPVIRRKPQTFSINGRTKIRGRVEIKDNNNTVIAVDNDVLLEGDYAGRFLNVNNFGGRKVWFSQINYSLKLRVRLSSEISIASGSEHDYLQSRLNLTRLATARYTDFKDSKDYR